MQDNLIHYIAGSVALSFLSIQLMTRFAVWLRLGSQMRLLRQIAPPLELFWSDPLDEGRRRKLPWLGWLHDRVRASHLAGVSGNGGSDGDDLDDQGGDAGRSATFFAAGYDRAEILDELHVRTVSYPAFLRRLGFMAPLVGLLITVAGFGVLAFGKFPAQVSSVRDIFLLLVPLIEGIAIGAVLALVNQWLLHRAERQGVRLQQEAREWFDASVWDPLCLEQQEESERDREQHQQFGEEIRNSLDRAVQRLTEQHTASEQARVQSEQVGEQIQTSLDDAVQRLTEVVTHFCKSAEDIVAPEQLRQTYDSQVETFTRLEQSIRDHVLPAHARLDQTVASLDATVQQIGTRMESASSELDVVAGRTSALAETTEQSLQQLGTTISVLAVTFQEHLVPTAEQCHTAVDSLAGSTNQIASTVESLDTGSANFCKLISDQSQAAADELEVVQRLRESVARDLHSTGRVFDETASELRASATALTESVEKISESADEGIDSMKQVMTTVMNITSGVSGGVDQFSQSVQRLEQSVGQHTAVAEQLSSTTQTIAETTTTLSTSCQSFADAATAQAEVSEAFAERVVPALRTFETTIGTLSTSSEGLSAAVGDCEEFIRSVADRAATVLPAAEDGIVGLRDTVAQFQVLVGDNLTRTIGEYQNTTNELSSTAESIREMVQSLDASSAQLAGAAAGQSEATDALRASIQNQLVTAHQTIAEAADGFSEAGRQLAQHTAGLGGQLDGTLQDVSEVLDRLAESTNGLEPAVTAFSRCMAGFAPSCDSYRQSMDGFADSTSQFINLANELDGGFTVLRNVVADHHQIRANVARAVGAMEEIVDRFESIGASLNESIEANVTPTQRSLREASAAMEGAIREFAQLAARLEPVTNRLSSLDQTLGGLEGTVAAIHQLSGMEQDMESLTVALGQVGRVADALQDLPDQVHAALERLAERRSSGNGGGGFLGFFRRPK